MQNTEQQQKAINTILSGKNVFITGGGGVGKSWVINQISGRFTTVVAPTGIAALTIGGSTCHKFFGLPFGLPDENDENILPRKTRGIIGVVDRIIIDEIGMLRADYFDLIDRKLKKALSSSKPFGGIQMVVVGDFYQLEPIVGRNEEEYFYDEYNSPFAFSSKAWDFETIELTEVKRQSDARQIELLEKIRRDTNDSSDALNEIHNISKRYSMEDKQLYLCAYNKDSVTINRRKFNQIQGEHVVFRADIEGNWGKQVPVPEKVMCKIGSRVLICANGEDYVNGSRGTVEEIFPTHVIVKLDAGYTVVIKPHDWEQFSYTKIDGKVKKERIAKYTQLPLRMGWAVSIHKSQGMTLDNVAVNVGNGCFGHGQLYVALSRVKDLSNISFVKPITPDNIIVRKEVKEFYSK